MRWPRHGPAWVSDAVRHRAAGGLDLKSGGFSPLALIELERQVLSVVGTGVPLDRSLEGLLLAVEREAGHSMLTSVLFLSEDGQRLVHGAAPNLPDAYNRSIDGILIGVGVGSCGTAAALAHAVYVTDRDRPALDGL